ncbi:hypothetical protein RUM43_002920 [Polyplax serrata]|uniref:Uncharacterized protein n=1 Tax=Polyplax serrata TaxID=468196 RepID=A0AAN8Q043_POLSC
MDAIARDCIDRNWVGKETEQNKFGVVGPLYWDKRNAKFFLVPWRRGVLNGDPSSCALGRHIAMSLQGLGQQQQFEISPS